MNSSNDDATPDEIHDEGYFQFLLQLLISRNKRRRGRTKWLILVQLNKRHFKNGMNC